MVDTPPYAINAQLKHCVPWIVPNDRINHKPKICFSNLFTWCKENAQRMWLENVRFGWKYFTIHSINYVREFADLCKPKMSKWLNICLKIELDTSFGIKVPTRAMCNNTAIRRLISSIVTKIIVCHSNSIGIIFDICRLYISGKRPILDKLEWFFCIWSEEEEKTQ